MFARGGGESDLGEGGDEIGGLLFDSFAAVFFWGPSERRVGAELTSFWFLEVAACGGDEGQRDWGEEERPGRRVHYDDYEGSKEDGNEEVQGPSDEISLRSDGTR